MAYTLWGFGPRKASYSIDWGAKWRSIMSTTAYPINRWHGEPGGPTSEWKIYVQAPSAYDGGMWRFSLSGWQREATDLDWGPVGIYRGGYDTTCPTWAAADDSLVVSVGCYVSGGSRIAARVGPHGTAWAEEYRDTTYPGDAQYKGDYALDVDGDPTGTDVFALIATENGSKYRKWALMQRSGAGVWSEVASMVDLSRMLVGIGRYQRDLQWKCIRVISATEVYIGGGEIVAGDWHDRIWKWDGATLTVVLDYQPPRLYPMPVSWGPNTYHGAFWYAEGIQNLWMPDDGSEGLAVAPNLYWNDDWYNTLYEFDGVSWSFREGIPADTRYAPRPPDIVTSVVKQPGVADSILACVMQGKYTAFNGVDWDSYITVDEVRYGSAGWTWAQGVHAIDVSIADFDYVSSLHVHLMCAEQTGVSHELYESRRRPTVKWDYRQVVASAPFVGHTLQIDRLDNHYMASLLVHGSWPYLAIWEDNVWRTVSLAGIIESPSALWVNGVDSINIYGRDPSTSNIGLWWWNGTTTVKVADLGPDSYNRGLLCPGMAVGSGAGTGDSTLLATGAADSWAVSPLGPDRYSLVFPGNAHFHQLRRTNDGDTYLCLESFSWGFGGPVWKGSGSSWPTSNMGMLPNSDYYTGAYCVDIDPLGTLWAMGWSKQTVLSNFKGIYKKLVGAPSWVQVKDFIADGNFKDLAKSCRVTYSSVLCFGGRLEESPGGAVYFESLDGGITIERYTPSEEPGLVGQSAYGVLAFDAPVVLNAFPDRDQTGIPVDSPVEGDILSEFDAPVASTIKITIDGVVAWENEALQNGYTGTVTAVAGGYRYSLTPPQSFDYYEVIDVEAYAENSYGYASTDRWYSFRTEVEHPVWAVGLDPAGGEYVLLFTGIEWVHEFTGTEDEQLRGVFALERDHILAVGDDTASGASVLYGDGVTWYSQDNGVNVNLEDVWAFADNDAWACGGDKLLESDGVDWTDVSGTLPVTKNWYGTWGCVFTDERYLVGADGTILRREGAGPWVQETSGVAVTLRAVRGSADGTLVMAVGDGGTVLVRVGGVWSAETSGVATDLLGCWVINPTNRAACGKAGTVIKNVGAGWVSIPHGSYDLRGIHMLTADDIWAVGTYTLVHHDGASWTPYDFPEGITELYAVYRISDTDPPYVDNEDPAPSSTDNSPSTDIVLDVLDDGLGVDESSVVLAVNGATAYQNSAEQAGFTVTRTSVPLGFRYRIDPDTFLTDPVTVGVYAEDFARNILDTSYQFEVGDPPQIIWPFPRDGKTGASKTGPITFKVVHDEGAFTVLPEHLDIWINDEQILQRGVGWLVKGWEGSTFESDPLDLELRVELIPRRDVYMRDSLEVTVRVRVIDALDTEVEETWTFTAAEKPFTFETRRFVINSIRKIDED